MGEGGKFSLSKTLSLFFFFMVLLFDGKRIDGISHHPPPGTYKVVGEAFVGPTNKKKIDVV